METQVQIWEPRLSESCSDWHLHEWGVEGTKVVEFRRADRFTTTSYRFVNGNLMPVPPASLLAEADDYAARGVPVYAPLGWRVFADPPKA